MATKLRPLSMEEKAAYAGYTHAGIVTADDLTSTVAGGAQTLKLGPIQPSMIVPKAVLVIRKPFRDKSDTAFNSVTMSLGDVANGATRFIAATQVNANANRVFNDGVTNTDTSFVSATAVFVAGDVGKSITGAGIPANTTIASRTNATTVVLSQATTATATGVSFTLPARTATPVTTPKAVSSVTLANTPYAAADEVDLVITPSPASKKLSDIDEGEAFIVVQKIDTAKLAQVKALDPITTK